MNRHEESHRLVGACYVGSGFITGSEIGVVPSEAGFLAEDDTLSRNPL